MTDKKGALSGSGTRPIRALLLADGLDRSETGVIVALSRRGVEIKVLLDTRGREAVTDLFDQNGIAYDHLSCRNRVDLAAIRRIRRELAAGRFDLMHAFINRPLSCGLWAAWGYRDLKRIAYRGKEGNVGRLDPAAWMTYLHPRLDRIICVSDAVRRSLLEVGIADRKLRVIHKGHDLQWYHAIERSGLEELGIPNSAFVVSCIANVRASKSIDDLILAWDELPPEPEIHLLLIGEVRDPEVQRLLRVSPHRDRLHAIGYRPDAAALQGACDLAAMVSAECEGLPRAIIEGQALGVPALVTDVGGMPEIVRNGDNGFIVPPRDSAAIADAILTAAADPDKLAEMGRRARERCLREFNIEATIEATLALYEDLVFGPGRC
jgi:glycosyltransferase involved in cell wall biosynthesis